MKHGSNTDQKEDLPCPRPPPLQPRPSFESHPCKYVFIRGPFFPAPIRGRPSHGLSVTGRCSAASPHFSANFRPFSWSSLSASIPAPANVRLPK